MSCAIIRAAARPFSWEKCTVGKLLTSSRQQPTQQEPAAGSRQADRDRQSSGSARRAIATSQDAIASLSVFALFWANDLVIGKIFFDEVIEPVE